MDPILFILTTHYSIRAVESRTGTGYNQLKRLKLLICAFVDDLMICASTEQNFQGKLKNWEEELKKFKINTISLTSSNITKSSITR